MILSAIRPVIGLGAPLPSVCTLDHRLFHILGPPVFRRADADRVAVMVVALGEKHAAIPLNTIPHYFDIASDTADGQMLRLIDAALDFVLVLRLGDKLPAEILTGAASWQPEPGHFQVASARLRLQLVGWLVASDVNRADAAADTEMLLAMVEDPAMRAQMQRAVQSAAQALGLPDSHAVLGRIEALAQELGHVEALRDWLLGGIAVFCARVTACRRRQRNDPTYLDTLAQVLRLARFGLVQIRQHFRALDLLTAEVMSALRHAETQRDVIRGHRDWLYRRWLAWQPLLEEWQDSDTAGPDAMRMLAARSYHFLAQRYLPGTEWGRGPAPSEAAPLRALRW